MAKTLFAFCAVFAILVLIPTFSAASDMEDRYEELLDTQGYVVKQNITVTSPTYFMVDFETLDNITLKCTAYFMEEVKLSDIYELTPDDEKIIFRVEDNQVNRFTCVKVDGVDEK